MQQLEAPCADAGDTLIFHEKSFWQFWARLFALDRAGLILDPE
jgi:hypothetical protein